MRWSVLVLSVLFVPNALGAAAIEFTNNSTIIRLGVSGNPDEGGSGGDSGGADTGNGSGSGSGSSPTPPPVDISIVEGRSDTPGGGGASSTDSGGAVDTGGTPADTGTGDASGGAGGATGAGAGQGGAGPSGNDVWVTYSAGDDTSGTSTVVHASAEVRETVYQGLVGTGAITFVPATTSASGAAGAQGGGGGLNGTMTVVGALVRAALAVHVDALDVLLDDWDYGPQAGGSATPADYGVAASAAIVYNAGLDEITFHASRIDITYKAKGLLLVVIPWKMKVTLTVDPNVVPVADRVQMHLPWYQMFVWKSFSKDKVVRDIAAAIEAQKKAPAGAIRGDPQLALFRAVTQLLRREAGMVQTAVQ